MILAICPNNLAQALLWNQIENSRNMFGIFNQTQLLKHDNSHDLSHLFNQIHLSETR